MSNIVARADPYTIVIIPEIRGPSSYQPRSGFNVSVGELAKVDYAEVVPRRYSGFAPGTSGIKFFVTSGSGNIITLEVWPGNLPTSRFSGIGLSHVAFGLRAYGH